VERLSDYDFELPEERIAQTPLEDRAGSRLLHLYRDSGQVEHRAFREVLEILQPGDLLVMNDTRVSALRLMGHKPTGAEVEALLLHERGPGLYEALLRPGKRLRPGATIQFGEDLTATVGEELGNGRKTVRFAPDVDLDARLRRVGTVPLPPYIHAALADAERYQTVYGREKGSAAAPTAGLHFTPEILAALRDKGVETATVTLHVGMDTFRPVTVDDPSEHPMHGEECAVSAETARQVSECRGRVVAVGTTTVRTLETFARGPRILETGRTTSRLFIRPGFNFQVVDGMFTNFHLPRTTMMMMISALSSRDRVMAAYGEALRDGYRFLSFGDSMLIL
jgi:S-adenosylmethionine:tRNA ribosyltransferase-isomerase